MPARAVANDSRLEDPSAVQQLADNAVLPTFGLAVRSLLNGKRYSN